MRGDPLSRPLIEIARDLRENRTSARVLIEAAIASHERSGGRLQPDRHDLRRGTLRHSDDPGLRRERDFREEPANIFRFPEWHLPRGLN